MPPEVTSGALDIVVFALLHEILEAKEFAASWDSFGRMFDPTTKHG